MTNSVLPPKPYLTAIVVIGDCRTRAQRVIHSLCSQTFGGQMEIIVVDIAPETTPALAPKAGTSIPYRYLRMPDEPHWGEAKAEAVRQASGEVVAFIEDHCFPAPRWAEAVARAFQSGPWAAVGYAFTNANPRSYWSRAGLFCDYHPWLKPIPGGPSRLLPGNNVAYRREQILVYGDRLATVIAPDFVLLEQLVQAGHTLYMEKDALAAHQNFVSPLPFLAANHLYCRMLGANRATMGQWSLGRRLFYGVAVLPGAPFLKFMRLIRGLPGRGLWGQFALALPMIFITHFWSAVGESLGYLFGEGNVGPAFQWYELDAERDPGAV